MIGLGTFLNPLLRIVVVVVTLAAVYFFILRPVLDTAEQQFDKFDIPDFTTLPADIQQSIEEAQQEVDAAPAETRKQKREQRQARKLLDCVQKAEGDVNRIQRCSERFQ